MRIDIHKLGYMDTKESSGYVYRDWEGVNQSKKVEKYSNKATTIIYETFGLASKFLF